MKTKMLHVCEKTQTLNKITRINDDKYPKPASMAQWLRYCAAEPKGRVVEPVRGGCF